jgi:hypothetical protein
MDDRQWRGIGLNRRAWLAGLAATWGTVARGGDDGPNQAAVDRDLEDVRARATKVGLIRLRVAKTEHYQGIGDAPDAFRKDALKLCAGLFDDYLKHFRGLGFDVKPPQDRLTVVILADAKRFAAFLGINLESAVGGVYDLDANRLVIFDNRATGNARGARANTVSLFHEATHQLTFNTGLLSRDADVPLVISEGLGIYGETRRPSGQPGIGALNAERLPVLAEALQSTGLMPVEQLFLDKSFDNPMTVQLAYAQSWLLVYDLLHSKNRRPKFRAYLEEIRGRRDPSRRVDDARKHLGDLGRLNQELQELALRSIR